MRSVCFTSQRRGKNLLFLSQGKWGRSVVRTQLLVFEQRRRAELYAKHSEAQGNPSLKILRANAGARIFYSYHKEGEKNKCEVFVLRANAGTSSTYHKESGVVA